MKKIILAISCTFIMSPQTFACSKSTIDSIVEKLSPYKSSVIGDQMEATLSALELCDENFFYAGLRVGEAFEPAYTDSTDTMADIIKSHIGDLPSDMVDGLGIGVISRLGLHHSDSTLYMLRAVVALGKARPEYAKKFTLELLKMQDASYGDSNDLLLQAVRVLKDLVPKPSPVPNPVVPPPNASPIWAFRSNNKECNGIQGPWGYYELCPRYFASVSDQFGNRIVLACKAENFGIEFRVTISPNNWSKIAKSNVQSIAFGTSQTMQSLGTPYLINQASTLMPPEPVAPEILNELRAAQTLFINVRANSGEVNTNLTFSLKGSNTAIGQLLQFCR